MQLGIMPFNQSISPQEECIEVENFSSVPSHPLKSLDSTRLQGETKQTDLKQSMHKLQLCATSCYGITYYCSVKVLGLRILGESA